MIFAEVECQWKRAGEGEREVARARGSKTTRIVKDKQRGRLLGSKAFN
jgi:hypothetical protein